MSVSNYLQVLVGSELEKLLTNRSIINVGDTLEGKVVQIQENNKVLMDFGKFRAVAKVNFPTVEGAIIPVAITSKEGGQLAMKIVEPVLNSVNRFGGRVVPKSAPPVHGDDIEGFIQKVEKVIKDGEIKLVPPASDLKGELLKVKVPENSGNPVTIVHGENTVSAGQNSSFQEHTTLLSGENTSTTLNSSLNETGARVAKLGPEVLELLKFVKDHFEPFSPQQFNDPVLIGKRIKRLVEKSGIFNPTNTDKTLGAGQSKEADFTNRITEFLKAADSKDSKVDLKPVLNILKERFEEIAEKGGENFKGDAVKIKGSIENLLQSIENSQKRIVEKKPAAARDEVGQQVFTFALPFKENQHRGKLKVYFNQKRKKGKKDGHKISLLLNMGKLGDIRTDFLMVNCKINITLFVKCDEVKAYIMEYLEELEEIIAQIFLQSELKVLVSPHNIENFDSEDVEEDHRASSLVDLKV